MRPAPVGQGPTDDNTMYRGKNLMIYECRLTGSNEYTMVAIDIQSRKRLKIKISETLGERTAKVIQEDIVDGCDEVLQDFTGEMKARGSTQILRLGDSPIWLGRFLFCNSQ